MKTRTLVISLIATALLVALVTFMAWDQRRRDLARKQPQTSQIAPLYAPRPVPTPIPCPTTPAQPQRTETKSSVSTAKGTRSKPGDTVKVSAPDPPPSADWAPGPMSSPPTADEVRAELLRRGMIVAIYYPGENINGWIVPDFMTAISSGPPKSSDYLECSADLKILPCMKRFDGPYPEFKLNFLVHRCELRGNAGIVPDDDPNCRSQKQWDTR